MCTDTWLAAAARCVSTPIERTCQCGATRRHAKHAPLLTALKTLHLPGVATVPRNKEQDQLAFAVVPRHAAVQVAEKVRRRHRHAVKLYWQQVWP